MKAFCILVLCVFCMGFWDAFGLTLNDKQTQAVIATIALLEAQRDQALQDAAKWRKKAIEHGCT